MSLSRLAIYTTAHGTDPVQAHLNRLEAADISPEIVAVELPDVDDVTEDINSLSRELLKRSPATGLVWHLVERINKREYENTDSTADRNDAEFEAGKQYADQHDIPHVAADLGRADIAARYATWTRRFRDAVVLLVGIGTAVTVWGLAALLALVGVGVLFNRGLTLPGLLGAVIGVGSGVVLFYGGRFVALYTIGKIGRWFRDTIRDIRDEAMYDRLKTASTDHTATEALLIVGASHFSGIDALASQDDVTCWQIESPAIEHLREDYDRFEAAAGTEGLELRVLETQLPFAIVLFDGSDLGLFAYDDGTLVGAAYTRDETALRWGEATFERFLGRSMPV
jgi:hypothetical protein